MWFTSRAPAAFRWPRPKVFFGQDYRHPDVNLANQLVWFTGNDRAGPSVDRLIEVLDTEIVRPAQASKRGRRLIDSDSLDSYLEGLTAKQALAERNAVGPNKR